MGRTNAACRLNVAPVYHHTKVLLSLMSSLVKLTLDAHQCIREDNTEFINIHITQIVDMSVDENMLYITKTTNNNHTCRTEPKLKNITEAAFERRKDFSSSHTIQHYTRLYQVSEEDMRR